MPPDVIKTIVRNWEKTVKSTISVEANMRTEYLETTPQGRHARRLKHPDGEELRMHYLNTLDVAKNIITLNVCPPDDPHRGNTFKS